MNNRIISLVTTEDTWFEVGILGVELIEAVNPSYKYRPHEGFYRIVLKTTDVYVPFHAVQYYTVDERDIEDE